MGRNSSLISACQTMEEKDPFEIFSLVRTPINYGYCIILLYYLLYRAVDVQIFKKKKFIQLKRLKEIRTKKRIIINIYMPL